MTLDYELRRAHSQWLADLSRPGSVFATFEAFSAPAEEEIPDYAFVDEPYEVEPRLEMIPCGSHRHPFDLELRELVMAVVRVTDRGVPLERLDKRARRKRLRYICSYYRGYCGGVRREIEYWRRKRRREN